MNTENKYGIIEDAMFDLRRASAIDAQIGEFVWEIYNMQSVKDAFDSLAKHFDNLTTFEKSVYLKLLPDTAELKVVFLCGFEAEKSPQFSFDIFEVPDKNIISAVFAQKTAVIKNGIDAINDLSLRLDMDNYVLIPMVLHAESENFPAETAVESMQDLQNGENSDICFVKEKELLKIVDFPVDGIFVFYCNPQMTDFEIKGNTAIAEKLIRLTGMTINNISVLKNLRKDAEDHKKELDAARSVQEKLLPEKLPCNDILQAAARYVPVSEIGGDYYDLFKLHDGIYAVFIADVTGHGISAALIMSAAKILLKTIASTELTPAQTLYKVNEEIINHIPTNRNLTAFYAIIDTKTQKMTYTSAGHCPILLFNKLSKEYQQFQSSGFSIGMFPELILPDHELEYEKSENRLCLYTDGVTDCFNGDKSQYGLIRLKTQIARTLELTTDEVAQRVMFDIRAFAGKHKFEDDLTLLLVDF